MATTKKKPTAAQLAARKLFAARAKAGTLKKKRSPSRDYARDAAVERMEAELRIAKKHAARKKNPAPMKGANNRHTPRKLAAPHVKYKYEIYFNGHRVAFASTEENARQIAQLFADKYNKTVEIRVP